MGNTFPPPGLCSFSALPDPYKTAFRLGSAHHLPGQFLPAHTDKFLQIFCLPFMLMYASPILILGPWLIIQAVRQPSRYLQFVIQVGATAQTPLQIVFIVLLFLLMVVLIGYCAWQAWDLAQSCYRTWHIARLRKNREYGYGLVLLSHGITGRLVNNFDWRHNCLWLPRQAIAYITWQKMREAGAKRSYWVYRTRICYLSATGDQHWLTLKGDTVRGKAGASVAMRDRDLYDTLQHWWQSSGP
ncbi:hypothetical protein [Halomicronema sp. CCY15110]|uniref:hypothetical protein n=1 Tax=Halomicronema sp. CCY15110 TaxID=2767773 RepID=UPI00194EE8EA|nr:hypothetical protein [Halomicronema sp. CCY15110]